MTLLDQITQALGASGALGQLGNAIGASESDTDALLGADRLSHGNGDDLSMLDAQGYGETQLKVDPGPTAADKAMNRRIEFVDIS